MRQRKRKIQQKQESLILSFKKREVTELQDLTIEGVTNYMKLLSNPEYFAMYNGIKYILGRQFHSIAGREIIVKKAIPISGGMLVVEAVAVVQTTTIIQLDNKIILNGTEISLRDVPEYIKRYIR